MNKYQEAVKRMEKQFSEEQNMVGMHKFAMQNQYESENIGEYIAALSSYH